MFHVMPCFAAQDVGCWGGSTSKMNVEKDERQPMTIEPLISCWNHKKKLKKTDRQNASRWQRISDAHLLLHLPLKEEDQVLKENLQKSCREM
jgi:hypothetical protein